MLVHNAVQSDKWIWLSEPLERLMNFYRVEGVCVKEEYIAYWILSLLMRGGNAGEVGDNDALGVKLSSLPQRFMK